MGAMTVVGFKPADRKCPGASGSRDRVEHCVQAFFFGMNGDTFPFAAALNLLTQNSLSRTLAVDPGGNERTRGIFYGPVGKFLRVTSGLGQTNVQFKPYGVELKFSPTVLENDTIQLQTIIAMSYKSGQWQARLAFRGGQRKPPFVCEMDRALPFQGC